MRTTQYWTVRALLHKGPVQNLRLRRFNKLQEAIDEVNRLKLRNEQFIEVDGYTPFYSDFQIVEVTKTEEFKEIEL